jgi:hypothetical protein
MTMTMDPQTPTLERQPTVEQQVAIDKYLTGENFVIVALAGTGKTTTLKMLADQNPARRGLYLSFNKAIAEDAKTKFQGTAVDCRTAHSLAYGGFGAPRKRRMETRMTPTDQAKLLGMTRIDVPGYGMVHKVAPPTAMKVVIDSITRFCSTSNEVIDASIVEVPARLNFTINDAGLAKTADDDEERQVAIAKEKQAVSDFVETIVHWAKIYWADIEDLNGSLPVSHSHYLKLWALSHPVLPYEYIMYDEAQDADPVTTGVVLEQTAQVVAVGDNYQEIYKWRGAVSAIKHFDGDVVHLLQSFRFGEDIAAFANVFLDVLGADIRIRGTEGKRSSVFTEKHSHRDPNAILCRTNGGAMNEILFWLKLGKKVSIAGEKKAQELRAIAQAALDLQVNHWTTHPDFKDFRRWSDVLEFVASEEESGNAQLGSMVNVIVRVGAMDIIAAIDTCVPPEEADITVSTVHVAKGLEWTHVRISGDFRPPKIDKLTNEVIPITAEEAMIMYVAVTRAKRHLDAKHLEWILDYEAGVID